MQARIFPGRGSGARSRTAASGRASPSRALRSSAERRSSKPSMRACMVACGVWPGGPTSATLTTPRSVSRPGWAGWPGCSKSTSLTVASARAPRSGAARALDLFRRVPERAEHPIVQPRPAGLVDEVRAYELPHHLAAGGHLEDASVAALADQRVAVGQALRARDIGAEEVEERLVVIFPHDRARARVHLDHARVRRGMIAAVGPIVEDQEIAAGQRARVVLLRQRRAAKRPRDRASAPIDDGHGGDVAKAHDEIAVS